MSKPLINTNKWSRDDIRLLVVMMLTVIYPLFVTSFFALYVFVLLPVMAHGHYDLVPTAQIVRQDGWYHAYWLFVALLWLLLCAIILPCFQDKKKRSVVGMEIVESPEFPTKTQAVQPFLKIEETNEKQRHSVLTDRSRGSSASIEKGVCEEKGEKESLEKSRESLPESDTLKKRKKLVESGEFLNEYIDTLDNNEPNKVETECEVHAEKAKEEEKPDNKEKPDENDNSTQDKKDDTSDEEKEKEGVELEPLLVKKEKCQQEAVPLKEANVASETPEDDEAADIEDHESPVKRRKARPTVDTSGANETYECSMPTPKSASSSKRESNMVFLFVNPDTLEEEEGVKVVHAGEVEKQED